jgi:hypothetical protein
MTLFRSVRIHESLMVEPCSTDSGDRVLLVIVTDDGGATTLLTGGEIDCLIEALEEARA